MGTTNNNAIADFDSATPRSLLEALGITQFRNTTDWYQTIGGLQVQGGIVNVGSSATLAILFPAPYETQLLGIFIQTLGAGTNAAYVNVPALTGFSIVNGVGARDYFWWAVGV